MSDDFNIGKRLLGLDPGKKRIGVAISDESRTIARPLEMIPAWKEETFLARLEDIHLNPGFGKIVLGNPLNMDGSSGPSSLDSERLKDILEARLHCPVVLWDERLTTKIAEQVLIQADLSRKKRKKVIDAQAAVVILQSYLDFLRRELPTP